MRTRYQSAGLQKSPSQRLVVYSNGWHMLTRDLQREVVLSDIAAWLADPAAALPSRAEVQNQLPEFCGVLN